MENKEIKITVPEGYEIDKENSTFECIKFKKNKKLTYEDVCDVLFTDKTAYYISAFGEIVRADSIDSNHACDANNAVSKKQLEQLLAINKLMNVAKHLNEKPLDWDDISQNKYHVYYRHDTRTLCYGCNQVLHENKIYFDSDEHAKQAVEILGEDVVKCALGVFD